MWVKKEPIAHTNLKTRKNKVWELGGAHKSLGTRKQAREFFVRFIFHVQESLSVCQQK
jgi:hypothetical protein